MGGQRLAGFRRRHHFVGIVAGDRADQLALAALARHDHRVGLAQGAVLEVEPQVGLARLGIRPVAGEAVFREDRQDVAAEIDRIGLPRHGRRGNQAARGNRQQAAIQPAHTSKAAVTEIR